MNSTNPKPAEDRKAGRFGAYSTVIMNHGLAIVTGIALMTVGSKIEIPFRPAPQTMQTASLMIIALGLPPRQALMAVASWLTAGLVGLPVFAGTPQHGIGLAYMMGPTGGYLLGFLLAAGLVSPWRAGVVRLCVSAS
ncbi:MAG: biotin transporter BioY [Hyphomicrobiales bacterium]